MAHNELQQSVHEMIEAVELLEKLLVDDEPTRSELARKISRAKMHLREARQDMRASRLGDPGVTSRF